MHIDEVAHCLLQIALGDGISESSLHALASYFAGSESEIETSGFIELTRLLQRAPEDAPGLAQLADRYRHMLAPPGFSKSAAQLFIDEFVAQLGPALLWVQPITMGYARRMQGSPFDLDADQSSGIPGWMILYTDEGQGVLDTGVRALPLRPGQAVLFEPGAVFSYQRAAESGHWGHYWITFQADAEWREWLGWTRVGPHIGYLDIDPHHQADIRSTLAQLHRDFLTESPVKQQLLRNLLEQLLIRCQASLPDNSGQGTDSRVYAAQRFIEDHYNRSFSLAEVADAANLSASRMAHLFREQTGTTVMGWRDEKRMMAAAQSLRGTRLAISRIAADVGYADTPFFSRTFKRLIGCTPRDYRNRNPN